MLFFQSIDTTMTDFKCELPCVNPGDDVRILAQDEIDIMNFRVNLPVKYLCQIHFKDHFRKYSGWYKKCCDPGLRHKQPRRSKLEVIDLKLAQNVSKCTEYRITPGQKICNACKNFLKEFIDSAENNGETKHVDSIDRSNETERSDDDGELSTCVFQHNLDTVNKALKELGLKCSSGNQAHSSSLVEKKICEVIQTIRNKLKLDDANISTGETVMNQYKDEFPSLHKQDQYRVLTSMPKQYGRPFLQNFFGISDHQAKIAKNLQAEKGILSIPDPKPGNTLPDETICKVKHFYENDKVSRQMGGMKDCVSMIVNGVKKKVRK